MRATSDSSLTTPQPEAVSLSRRAFLRGRTAPAPSAVVAPPGVDVSGVPLAAAIGDACLARRGVECRVCGESCDAGAIRFKRALGGVAHPEITLENCTGCGDCVVPCPGSAIALAPVVAPEPEGTAA